MVIRVECGGIKDEEENVDFIDENEGFKYRVRKEGIIGKTDNWVSRV